MEQLFKVMLARFPGNNCEHPGEVDFIINFLIQSGRLNETPVTMSRNRCVADAIERGVDILVMVDSDMGPDLIDPTAHWWPRALDFIARRWNEAPTVIAAPYCGPPPHENVYIFRWRNYQSNNPNPDFALSQFTREEAAERRGIEAVAALPTGLIAIDMRVFTGFPVEGELLRLPTPWFYYEWEDERQTHKSSTEDVTFTRDVALLFGAYGLDSLFVDWDTWAVHFKPKAVGKPAKTNPGDLARLFKKVAASDDEKEIYHLEKPGSY
jgi:hypothetical protein